MTEIKGGIVIPIQAITDKSLSHADIRVLSSICSFLNQSNQCCPSYQEIAKVCNMDKRNVQKHIKKLEKNGYLVISPRAFNNNATISNEYSILYSRDKI